MKVDGVEGVEGGRANASLSESADRQTLLWQPTRWYQSKLNGAIVRVQTIAINADIAAARRIFKTSVFSDQDYECRFSEKHSHRQCLQVAPVKHAVKSELDTPIKYGECIDLFTKFFASFCSEFAFPPRRYRLAFSNLEAKHRLPTHAADRRANSIKNRRPRLCDQVRLCRRLSWRDGADAIFIT